MQGVGTATTGYPVANVVGHAVVGCASSAAGGGSCRDGAISAGVGAAMTQATGPAQATPAKFAGAVVAGGVSAELTGRDFREGAKAAATWYLLKALPDIYEDVVGYELDMGPGGAAVGKRFTEDPRRGANNWGGQYQTLDPDFPFMAPAPLVTYAAAFGQMLNAMPGPTYFYFEPKSNRDKRAH